MSDREVLTSDGYHADSYHVPVGNTHLAACGRNAQADREFDRVPEADAREQGYTRCSRCTFETDETHPETDEQAVTDGGHAPEREVEAGALFASHGVADGLTTVLAAREVGLGAEANPLMAALLAEGYGVALGVMLAVVGSVAVAWPHLASRYELPSWFAWVLVTLGVLVALGNVAVIAGWSA